MVYIFEGEKCAQAAHHLNLPALTSMMGSNQSHLADWAILAGYRHLKNFVLVPDNDPAGRKYISVVHNEIKKACPRAKIWVLNLPNLEKGSDFVDWIHANPYCPSGWNGLAPIDEPHSKYLKQAFVVYAKEHLILADQDLAESEDEPVFEGEPEPIHDILNPVLPCLIETLPDPLKGWMQSLNGSDANFP